MCLKTSSNHIPVQQISKSQNCSSRYPIKWKWRTLALSKAEYSYCCLQPTWPPVSGLFIPLQLWRNIIQQWRHWQCQCQSEFPVPKWISQCQSEFPKFPIFPSPFPCGVPMAPLADWDPLLMQQPPQRGAGLASSAPECSKINNNPSLLQSSVPKMVLMFFQSFLFILQALHRHFI